MDQAKIVELVNHYVAKANKKFSINLDSPKVEFYNMSKVAGRAWCRENRVSFNLTLAAENPETFHETVCHEVAHLVTRKVFPNARQSHGPEFKHVDIELGGRGTRCHSYDTTSVKREVVRKYVTYQCKCRTHDITPATHKKIYIDGRTYKCKLCGHVIQAVRDQKGYVQVTEKSNKAK